jgi:glycosyltransferase involved in cell wall biosynthesis
MEKKTFSMADTVWPLLENITHRSSNSLNQTNWPKVSIVTPSFNQGNFIEETIRSVLLQDYPNVEYIIIDGGSTDNTIEIVKKYEPFLNFWVSEPDGGQADAINKGFKKATGYYLGWLNSDDILYPNAIKQVVKAFRLNPEAELIYGDIEQGLSLSRSVTQLKGEEINFSEMLSTMRVPIPQQGSLWKRSVVERVGGLDPRWQVVLDREFYTRVAEKCNIFYIHELLGFFRNHEKSKSVLEVARWLVELPLMYREFFERSDLSKEIRNLENKTMGAMFLTCASISIRCGDGKSALGYLADAIKSDPLALLRRNVRSKASGILRSMMHSLKV